MPNGFVVTRGIQKQKRFRKRLSRNGFSRLVSRRIRNVSRDILWLKLFLIPSSHMPLSCQVQLVSKTISSGNYVD